MNRFHVATVGVLLLSAVCWSDGPAQEKKNPEPDNTKPSATIDFSPTKKLLGKGKAWLRMEATAANGITFRQDWKTHVPQLGVENVFATSLCARMRNAGFKEGVAGIGWDCVCDEPRGITLTTWSDGQGKKFPLKSVRVFSPDVSVPAAFLPIITVRGGVVVATPTKPKGEK